MLRELALKVSLPRVPVVSEVLAVLVGLALTLAVVPCRSEAARDVIAVEED